MVALEVVAPGSAASFTDAHELGLPLVGLDVNTTVCHRI
jgi:hypothetical protein